MSAKVESDWPEELAPRQKAFLEAFSRCGSVVDASEGVCGRASHYRWLEESELYKSCFGIAEQLFSDRLMKEAVDRALNGAMEMVWHKGLPVFGEDGMPMYRKKADRYLLKHLIARSDRQQERERAAHQIQA